MRKEMEKSGGQARVVPVPGDRCPTPESLRSLEYEIASQISANEAMRNRSMLNATKRSVR